MKTIYNVYVPIENQEQADRMKQICIDYGLPYFDDKIPLKFSKNENWFIRYTIFSDKKNGFGIYSVKPKNKTQVTESEFLELVKINFAN